MAATLTAGIHSPPQGPASQPPVAPLHEANANTDAANDEAAAAVVARAAFTATAAPSVSRFRPPFR